MKKRSLHLWRPTALLLLLSLASVPGIPASIPSDGRFLAERDCPALTSIKRQTNPGGLRVTPGREYPLLGSNRPEGATHYQIRLEGAQPAERWVEVGCGARGAAPATPAGGEQAAAGKPPGLPPAPVTAPPGAYILAATWQPAFCEIRGARPECRGQTRERRDASHFSLHGLWPQPADRAFCGVSAPQREIAERGPWSRLPVLDLGEATRAGLDATMPGSLSHLDRYEWIKHGTCYGTGPDAYFQHALGLMEQLNASPVRGLFADRIGQHLTAGTIRASFEEAFGRGAGARVKISCDEGMIAELQIGLAGAVGETASLAALIRKARSQPLGCRGGRVDAAGVTR